MTDLNQYNPVEEFVLMLLSDESDFNVKVEEKEGSLHHYITATCNCDECKGKGLATAIHHFKDGIPIGMVHDLEQ